MYHIERPKPTEWVSCDTHPGVWFKDVFSELSHGEKVAWLELLTLAIAANWSGKVGFCSERQIASIFAVDESTFSTVLKKAQDLWMIEVTNKAILPYWAYYDMGFSAVPKDEGPDEFEPGALYREMVFPALYQYNRPGSEPKFMNWGKRKPPRSFSERILLDSELEQPLALLRERIEKTENGELVPMIVQESPLCNWSSHMLPMNTLFVWGNSEKIAERLMPPEYQGLALWDTDQEGLLLTINHARNLLKSTFELQLSRELDHTVYRPF